MREFDEIFEDLQKEVRCMMESDGKDYDVLHNVFETSMTMRDAIIIGTDGGGIGIVGQPSSIAFIWATITLQILKQYKGQDRNEMYDMLKYCFDTVTELKDKSDEEIEKELSDKVDKAMQKRRMSSEEIKSKLEELTEKLRKLEEENHKED